MAMKSDFAAALKVMNRRDLSKRLVAKLKRDEATLLKRVNEMLR